ncbi:hypothetical protein ACFQH2_13260 [Natronoarchaeum sp. GCM10025703]|uniref:hypothetical protein n=1 Tax=unclassified Natronoarchaeum TaxID=2620183 RepID=UPI00361079C0
MSQTPSLHTARQSPSADPFVAALLTAGVFALIIALSYPVLSFAVFAGALTTLLARRLATQLG